MKGRKSWHGFARMAAAASVIALTAGQAPLGWAQETAPISVPVRYGSHPTYERLVFDFPAQVGYRLDQQGNSATITFDQRASFDQAQLTAQLARVAGSVAVSQDGNATVLKVQLADGVKLRHFRSGARVVLDFSRGDTPATAAAPAPAPAAT